MTRARRVSVAATATVLVFALLATAVLSRPVVVPAFAAVRSGWTPATALLLDRYGALLDEERIDFSVRRTAWVPLSAISPALLDAIVAGEDHRFWLHHGVDWRAAAGALRDAASGHRRRGASTITMQLAALLDPSVRAGSGAGAWWRKLAQIRAAHALEARWRKPEILEAYLNLLGFRGELQGIGAAAGQLAGKAPAGLSTVESLVLAALLPAPGATRRQIVARACARPSARRLAVDCAAIGAAAVEMLRRAPAAPRASRASTDGRDGDVASVNGSAKGDATAELSADRSGRATDPVGRLAPHLARALLTRAGEQRRTTLDADTQRTARDILRAHLRALITRNVRDGAVLVADNATGEVLAYVASAGPVSTASHVDGVRAHRQAGSTLKPFLYELALERGYLTAASLLDDSAVALQTVNGVYLPQDYDREFKGLVSVRVALGSSLNIPAVRTLVLTGVEPFRDRLNSLGYSGITQSGDFYGYALALGSAEVSLWEQVQAYRTLARGGRWSPLRVVPDAPAPPDRAAFSADAGFIVADILSDRAARTATFGLDSHLDTPFWSAVKTGTSKDMRDNWCIGFSRRFTVGVWVGNFEGDAMHDVSGVTGAAPVWQEVMLALHARLPSPPPPLPAGVSVMATRFTPAREAPRRELFIDPPPDQLIAAAPGVARIASPADGMIIALDPDIPPANQRMPFTTRGAVAGMVLRLNGAVVGQPDALWSPRPGRYLLALQDAAGHTVDEAHFVVR